MKYFYTLITIVFISMSLNSADWDEILTLSGSESASESDSSCDSSGDDTLKTMPDFTKYFQVGFLPYADQKTADIIFWRATVVRDPTQRRGVEVHRFVGARPFIEVLKKEYKPYMYKKNISKKIVRKIACKYVRCIDNTTYLERLAQVEAVMNCCRDQEFSSSNPKADEYRDLACPALVRQASESIRAFPPEEDFSTVRFYACVKRYLENHGHQGSYVVGPNYASTKQFLKEVEEAIGYADSTGWQALEVQPQLLAPQIFQETPIS